MFIYQPFYFAEMLGPGFNISLTELKFNQRISSVFKMQYSIRFQIQSVMIVRYNASPCR